MKKAVHCVADSRCLLGEAPVWCASTHTLYWLDIAPDSRLHAWTPFGAEWRTWRLGEVASGLASTLSGALLIVAQSGLSHCDPARNARAVLGRPPAVMDRMRFNDCGCDRHGRLWTGTMRNDRVGDSRWPVASAERDHCGGLLRVDPDLTWHTMASNVGCPNTFAWSLDDSILYTADSSAGRLYAYDYDIATGALGERRVFAEPPNLGIPDGSALDREGHLWNSRWGAGCVARFAPDGRLVEVVAIPADLVTSCAFGGSDLGTLFVTTAHVGLAHDAHLHQPRAGGVFAFRPDVPGCPRAPFRFSDAQLGASLQSLVEMPPMPPCAGDD